MELRLQKKADGHIELTSTIVRTESRDPVKLLDPAIPRSHNAVRICSMCKKISLHPTNWVEIEEGLVELEPFQADQMPMLSHGLCPRCLQMMLPGEDLDLEGIYGDPPRT